MTTETEALRRAFEGYVNPDADIDLHWQAAGYYASRGLQTSWLDFQAGHAAAKAETAAAVAKERERASVLYDMLLNRPALNAGLESEYAAWTSKCYQVTGAYKAAIRAGAKEPSDEARPPGAVVDEQAARDVLAERQRQIAAEGWEGEPFGYFRAEPFGWTDCAEGDEGAVALYEKAGVTDATLHKIIYNAEAALDAAGAPAGTLVERIGALAEDAARWRFSVTYRDDLRMNWLVVYDEWDGDGDFTAAIDAARTQQDAG